MSFSGVREERLKTPLPRPSPSRFTATSSGVRLDASASLDFAFSAIVFDIQRRLKLVARVPKVRVEFWLRKLHELETNVVWKKNRNNHARLLLNNLSRGVLEHPFDKAPEEGRLKMLPQHALFAIRGDGFGATPAKGSATLKRPSASRNPAGDKPSPDAEASLRDLLRRAEVAVAAGAAGEEDLRGHPSSSAAPERAKSKSDTSDAERRAKLMRGWREDAPETADAVAELDARLREDETLVPREKTKKKTSRGERGAPDETGGGTTATGGEEGSGSRGRRELEAELGAAKEKIKELEWRLQRTKRELAKRDEELEALSRDALNAAKASGREKSDLKKQHARELEEMINVFEKKRAEWAPRAAEKLRAAGASPGASARTIAGSRGGGGGAGVGGSREGGGGGGGGKRRGKEDFFRYLDAFQRQTDELQRNLTPGKGSRGR
jgi:hypothetical protein